MKSVKQTDILTGSIPKQLLLFFLPIWFGTLFQQLYNTADALIVGNMLGNDALAAVSSTGTLVFLLVSFFAGISAGAGVAISRYYGAREHDKMELAIHTNIAFNIVAGILLTIVGVCFTPTILRWMSTPEDVFEQAALYVRIYFAGSLGLVMYNSCRGIMQAVGDLNIPVIVIFVVGAVAGIISFSHLLSWLLKHWHDVTVAVLMGFMVGSLNKVWPWKEVVETYTDSHGKIMPLVESNVAPGRFEALTQQDALLAEAIVLCIVGFLAIYCIELAARIVVKKQEE